MYTIAWLYSGESILSNQNTGKKDVSLTWYNVNYIFSSSHCMIMHSFSVVVCILRVGAFKWEVAPLYLNDYSREKSKDICLRHIFKFMLGMLH